MVSNKSCLPTLLIGRILVGDEPTEEAVDQATVWVLLRSPSGQR